MVLKKLRAARLWWLPADIGVAWGADLNECRERYHDSVVFESETRLSLRLCDGTQPCNTLELVFNDAHRLERLQEMLAISRDFWDGFEPEEYDSVQMEYEAIFRDRLAECQSVLGSPDFFGESDSPGYPNGELAAPIAIWELDDCRIQLEFDNQDQEFPFIVRITTSAKKSHS